MQTFEKGHWLRGIGDQVFDRFRIESSLLGFQSFAGISPSMVSWITVGLFIQKWWDEVKIVASIMSCWPD